MRILVTGGSGFIGNYLIDELLKYNYEIKILTRQKKLDNNKFEFITGDITNIQDCLDSMNEVDVVFHNAAYATDFGTKKEIINVNINGTNNIANACVKKGIDRVIYTSTAGVYGFPNINKKIDEKFDIKPFNIYHKSKFEGEKILKRKKDLKVSIVRPPLVLGSGGKGTDFIVNRIKNGKMIYIGDGNQYITIVHPSDVAQCLRLAFEKDKIGEIFNVVSFYCKIKELFSEISRQLNVNEPNRSIPYYFAYLIALLNEKINIKEPTLTRFRVKSMGTTRFISYEKAKKIIKYEPKYDIKKTVEDMLKNYF